MRHFNYFPLYFMSFMGAFTASPAMAGAPFCAVADSISPQCYYYDAKSCRDEASKINGICQVNEKEIALPEGYGNYCLVYSIAVAECLYLDYNSCDTEAHRKNGVCIRNFTKPEPLPSFEFNSQGAYQTF